MEAVKLESTITLWFTVTDSTGALVNADSTPTCNVFEDTTTTAILSPTVTQDATRTGHYYVSIPCTTANGFEDSKSYNVVVTCVVSTVTSAATIASFQCFTNSFDSVLVSDKTGFRLSADGVDDILDEVVEGSSTMRQYLKGIAAVLFGQSSGGGSATITFESPDTPGTNRVTATVDANGNRTAMTLNL